MSQNGASLRRLLDQVFADGIVELGERDALSACHTQMSPADVTKVFVKFLSDKWGEASADGRITGPERALLLRIIEELNLAAHDLPAEVRIALAEH